MSATELVCVKCKVYKFYSWPEFENHHSQHAVNLTIRKLPTVVIKRLDEGLLSPKGTYNCSQLLHSGPAGRSTPFLIEGGHLQVQPASYNYEIGSCADEPGVFLSSQEPVCVY